MDKDELSRTLKEHRQWLDDVTIQNIRRQEKR